MAEGFSIPELLYRKALYEGGAPSLEQPRTVDKINNLVENIRGNILQPIADRKKEKEGLSRAFNLAMIQAHPNLWTPDEARKAYVEGTPLPNSRVVPTQAPIMGPVQPPMATVAPPDINGSTMNIPGVNGANLDISGQTVSTQVPAEGPMPSLGMGPSTQVVPIVPKTGFFDPESGQFTPLPPGGDFGSIKQFTPEDRDLKKMRADFIRAQTEYIRAGKGKADDYQKEFRKFVLGEVSKYESSKDAQRLRNMINSSINSTDPAIRAQAQQYQTVYQQNLDDIQKRATKQWLYSGGRLPAGVDVPEDRPSPSGADPLGLGF